MPFDPPSTPAPVENQTYEFGGRTWIFKPPVWRALGDAPPPGGEVTLTGVQSLSNKTLDNFRQKVFTITDGASVDIDPANGPYQLWILTANRTPTATNFLSGQTVILKVGGGAFFSVDWTTGMDVRWTGGSAPPLPTSGSAMIMLWKDSTFGVINGAWGGNTP